MYYFDHYHMPKVQSFIVIHTAANEYVMPRASVETNGWTSVNASRMNTGRVKTAQITARIPRLPMMSWINRWTQEELTQHKSQRENLVYQ